MVEIDKIYSLAKERGLSNSFLCKKLGRSTSYLNDARNGKHGISDNDLKILADILNTTPEYLKGETDTKEKTTAKSDGLTEDEMKLLNIFRSLSEDEQKLFLKMFSSNQE